MFLITANARRRWRRRRSIISRCSFTAKRALHRAYHTLKHAVVARIPIDHKDFNSRGSCTFSQLQLANICNNNTPRLSNSSRRYAEPRLSKELFFLFRGAHFRLFWEEIISRRTYTFTGGSLSREL